MKPRLFLLIVVSSCLAQEWRSAQPGWNYDFPRDHHIHPDFKTEWWYFTGNLQDNAGRRFGFELTFFREGIIPPLQQVAGRSRFIVNDLKFAHFTVTDAAGRKFDCAEKASRGAFNDAGFDRGNQLAWINDWTLELNGDGDFILCAQGSGARLRLALRPQKQPVIHGSNGISAKASDPGYASHYYSITRLAAAGEVELDSKRFQVNGSSWFDHEWASNRLAPHQVGWNWVGLQFSNGADLMLYQMRRDDGTTDSASSGTLVAGDGTATLLTATDFSMTSSSTWKSDKSGATYPIVWRVTIPSQKIAVDIRPVLNDQELAFVPLTYWEGAVDVSSDDKGFSGVGYLELTGYANHLRSSTR